VIKNTVASITKNLYFDSMKIYGYPDKINTVTIDNQIANTAIITSDSAEKVKSY
jgi:hypothetical protein